MKTWQNGSLRDSVLSAIAEYSEIIFFDTETSGLDPSTDRILELAANKYAIKNGILIEIGRLHVYINPSMVLTPEVVKITGITNEFLDNKTSEKDAFVSIYNFFGETPQIIAAYNTPFDIGFLQAMYVRNGKQLHPQCLLDVLPMARNLVEGLSDYKLQTVVNHFNLPGDKFHTAEFDTECTVNLFKIFLKQYSDINFVTSTYGGKQPNIQKISFWSKTPTLRRIYVTTDCGNLFYDLWKRLWTGSSKDTDLTGIDMEYVEKECWYLVGAENQLAFDKFTGKWII